MIKETQRYLGKQENIDVSNSKEFFHWLKKNDLMTFKFESAYTLRNFYQFPVVLQTVLQKKQKGRNNYKEYVMIFSYTTNIDASGEYLNSLYKKRWGIETQYRIARQFQARTSSVSTGL
jgi:IS4 transposase